MRLLIVGGSPLLGWIVRRLVPDERRGSDAVEVDHARTLCQARAAFRDLPPDAVLLEVTPGPGLWREIADWCRRHRPPIPTLFYTGAYLDPSEVGLSDADGLFTHTLGADELDRLIRLAEGKGAVAA